MLLKDGYLKDVVKIENIAALGEGAVVTFSLTGRAGVKSTFTTEVDINGLKLLAPRIGKTVELRLIVPTEVW